MSPAATTARITARTNMGLPGPRSSTLLARCHFRRCTAVRVVRRCPGRAYARIHDGPRNTSLPAVDGRREAMPHSFRSATPLSVPDPAAVAAGLDRLGRPPEWLLALEDPDRVLAELRANRALLGIDGTVLQGCKFKRADLAGGIWSTLHRLRVRDGDEADVAEIDLRGRLRLPGQASERIPAQPPAPERWHGYLPDLRLQVEGQPVDAAPLAPPGSDEHEPARSIEAALRARGGRFSGLRLAGCRPRVMRYRPGLRCTIRYDLAYPPGARPDEWPDAVIAKLYEDEDQAQHTYTAMAALWRSPLGRST